MTLTVEAGVTLAQVQRAADDANLLFPLSLASEGSCTIGGNIATNAGGTHVLRYGMTRALVLGLEVVLPGGAVLEMLPPAQGLPAMTSSRFSSAAKAPWAWPPPPASSCFPGRKWGSRPLYRRGGT